MWEKAGFKNYNLLTTPTASPNLTYNPYSGTTEGIAKKDAADKALAALNGLGEHEWANEQIYNDWLNKKLNREDFSYDINSDALYKQYAEQYRNMGKLAMEDTMGRAAAMTGGYGNSYAATVGNQAYQAYLGELNDVIPELYQMALQKYTMEGEQIDSNLAALGVDYNKSLGEWQNKYGMLKDKYDVLNSDYINSATLYDSEQDSLNDIALKNAQWDESIRQSELDQYWKENLLTSVGSGGSGDSGDSSGKWWESGTDDDVIDDDLVTDTETKGWFDHDTAELEKNQIENGGSYYQQTKLNIDTMINNGKSYDEMMSFVQELVGNNYISKSEYLSLVQYIRNTKTSSNPSQSSPKAQYKTVIGNSKGWSMEDDGGANLFGIDENAKVKAPDGTIWSLDELKEQLIKEGMSKSDAKKAIKKLQQDIGISSNWFFGL